MFAVVEDLEFRVIFVHWWPRSCVCVFIADGALFHCRLAVITSMIYGIVAIFFDRCDVISWILFVMSAVVDREVLL